MLYQERVMGRRGLWSRLTAGLVMSWRTPRPADVDLLSMSPHLRRDLGLDEGQGGVRVLDVRLL